MRQKTTRSIAWLQNEVVNSLMEFVLTLNILQVDISMSNLSGDGAVPVPDNGKERGNDIPG